MSHVSNESVVRQTCLPPPRTHSHGRFLTTASDDDA